jgi:two-component system, NtrC family, response regulator AtoC
MSRILVIEQNHEICTLIEREFNARVAIEHYCNFKAAVERSTNSQPDLLIWDAPRTLAVGARVVQCLSKLSHHLPQTPTLIISDSPEPDFPGIKDTAYYWMRRPSDEAEILALVETVIDRKGTSETSLPTDALAAFISEFEGILATSLTMRSVIQQILEAAADDIPVLITGETGTGKDLVAAAIHKRSKRKDAPFLPVNMGAIASELIASELFGHEKGAYTGASETRAGYFEQARGGTIFLDEITTMDEKTQVSLLRVLENKTMRRVRGERDIKVDVRVIAASNENIEEVVKAGRFREDLYYRLDVFRIHLPPLRERYGGVALLTDHFVSRFGEQYKKSIRVVAPETYRLLRRYPWPGNVRELKNVIQRAVLLAKGQAVTTDLLPARFREQDGAQEAEIPSTSPIHLGMNLAEVEKEFIKLTLASVNGNKMKAASILGISRRALYNKLKRFGLL